MTLYQKPKGCIDLIGEEYDKIHAILEIIRKRINQFPNIKSLDTPVFERSDVLKNKYGDEAETKLIYDLADQGGEKLSLRYDLTVPLARYCIENNISHLRRYQYGKVYRRDQPAIMQGRYREFYQFDLDFIGDHGFMNSEVEIFKLINLIMVDLKIDKYMIRLNFRENLLAIYKNAKIPDELHKTVSSSIDKLDKTDWDHIEKELLEKGLNLEQVTAVKQLIQTNYLDSSLEKDIMRLITNCKIIGAGHLEFDASLARGLDYYTGIIYEVVVPDSDMGSVIAGGRYDQLISAPSIGVSFGVSRLAKLYKSDIKTNKIVYIAPIGDHEQYKLMIVGQILDAGISVDYSYSSTKKMQKHLKYCLEHNIDYIIMFGDHEIDNDTVAVKCLSKRIQEEIPRKELVHYLACLI